MKDLRSRVTDGLSFIRISFIVSHHDDGEIRYRELDIQDVFHESQTNIPSMITAEAKRAFGIGGSDNKSIVVLAAKIEELDMMERIVPESVDLSFLLKSNYSEKNLLHLEKCAQDHLEMRLKTQKQCKFKG